MTTSNVLSNPAGKFATPPPPPPGMSAGAGMPPQTVGPPMPAAVPPPSDENIRAIAHVIAGLKKAEEDAAGKVSMAQLEKDDELFDFGTGFLAKAAGMGLSVDQILAAATELNRQSPDAGAIIDRLVKAAMAEPEDSMEAENPINPGEPDSLSYKVDKPEARNNKFITGNQLWRRRGHSKVAFTRGLAKALPYALGGGAGAAATPFITPEGADSSDLATMYLKNVGTGLLLPYSARALRGSKFKGPTLAGELGGAAGLNLYGIGKIKENLSREKQTAATTALADAEARQAETAASESAASIEAAKAQQAAAAAAEAAAKQQAAQASAGTGRETAGAVGSVLGGVGLAGLGAYGIYYIINDLRRRREARERKRGRVRVEMPGTGVSMDIPTEELPDYMQKKLMSNLRKGIRGNIRTK